MSNKKRFPVLLILVVLLVFTGLYVIGYMVCSHRFPMQSFSLSSTTSLAAQDGLWVDFNHEWQRQLWTPAVWVEDRFREERLVTTTGIRKSL